MVLNKKKRRKEIIWFAISLIAFLASFIFDGLLDGHWFHDLIVIIMCAGFLYIWDNRSSFRSRNNEGNNASH